MSAAIPSIVRGGEADAARIAALHATLFDTPWSVDTFSLMLSRENVIGLMARDGQSLSGFAFIQVILDEAELMSIGVAQTARRRGIGGTLLQACLAQAALAGARALHLEVATTNVAAGALYRRHGFQPVGLRKGYYATPVGRVDALLMRVGIV